MKQSKLFTKTRKEISKEETSLNANLLTRGGFVNKEMAGIYSFLPLGLRVIKKIERVVRDEIKKELGAQEVLMPSIHPLKNYEITGRDKIDVLFYTKLNGGGDLVLGQSHEEVVVPLFQHFVSSYKDFPCGIFQIQTKFRNELRAKAGILRGREFLMKDLYSFHTTQDCFDTYYKNAQKTYHNIYKKLGIGDSTYLTFASGGTFSKYSHEFQTICDVGEDEIYFCENCNIAVNKEIIDEVDGCPECKEKREKMKVKKSIEVGNIFPLGTKFSDSFGLTYKDEGGNEKRVIMGCYGIGISRVMGTIVEVLADKKGIVWPKNIAPFFVHLLSLSMEKEAEGVYNKLREAGIEVLFDDRQRSPGEKFAESDLIGIPYRMVVSEKTLRENSVEIKKRDEEKTVLVKINEIVKYVQEIVE